jgi:phosphatidylglycerophosphatase C
MVDGAPSARVVAAFDFDRTLSRRDNVVPFLREAAGSAPFVRALVMGGLTCLGTTPANARDALKAAIVRRLLTGRDAAEIEELGRAFADDVVAHHLDHDVVERADWHRTQGHHLVIVSASFGVYLHPIAERLRFDAALATELEVAADGRLTGRILGANVRGVEKVRRLDRWLGGSPAVVWAYGNGAGDRALWARADHAVRVPHGHRGTRLRS